MVRRGFSKQYSFFFVSVVPAGACRALFATCESKAACNFSLKLIFLLHFRPWDLSRKMRREILIEKEVLNVLRDAWGVELWTFYCKPKNFGPNVIYYLFVSAKRITSFKQYSFSSAPQRPQGPVGRFLQLANQRPHAHFRKN